MTEFFEENGFNRDQYEAYLRRIHYDDRDAANYENMLKFLWEYVVRPDSVEDREGLLEEYGHWNMQLVEKCFYRVPFLVPYANIRRAYQSFVHLLDGRIPEGLKQLYTIGEEVFSTDGKAPRMMMNQKGTVYYPTSKLFLLYNYDKVMARLGMVTEREEFRQRFAHAFTIYGDEAHEDHDAFLRMQLEDAKDLIYYPVYERIYKLPWGPKDFYMYYDSNKAIRIDDII